MAVIFVEGFDIYNGTGVAGTTSVGLASRWDWPLSGSLPLYLTTGRFGGQALRLTDRGAYANLPSSYSSGCVGFAFNQTAATTLNNSSIFFGVGTGYTVGDASVSTTSQIWVTLNTDNSISVLRGSTVLGTSTAGVVTIGAWSYLETEFVISDTVGEVRMYLNNNPTPIISLSGVDTKQLTGGTFNQIVLGIPDALRYGDTNFDDLYVTDTPNRLGEQRVITSYPNSDVLTDYWSSSSIGAAPYTMVDETLCDADTTYASSSTLNSRLVLGVPSLPVPPDSVNAVQIVGFARKDETEFRQLALEYENSVGAVSTGPVYTLNTTYIYTNNLMPQNPLTGNPWAASEINSMRIGARVVS